jgi:hypothetical protein
MTTSQLIKETELISQDLVNKDLPVFAKEVPLALAINITGLRAIFEEVFTSNLFSYVSYTYILY